MIVFFREALMHWRLLVLGGFLLSWVCATVGCGDTAPVAPKPKAEDIRKGMEQYEKK